MADLENPAVVFIHSPLVGPTTWVPVREEFQKRGYHTILPEIKFNGSPSEPYWKIGNKTIISAVEAGSAGPLVLIAHSGAGMWLPAVAAELPHKISLYIFVDAVIPIDGWSSLDLMQTESAEFAQQFRKVLSTGEIFPRWSDEDLGEIIPDRQLRQSLLKELQPKGLDFFSEPVPVFPSWPDAPCAYLQFSPFYESYARRARDESWLSEKMEGGHFHMLVNPKAVSQLLLHWIGMKVG